MFHGTIHGWDLQYPPPEGIQGHLYLLPAYFRNVPLPNNPAGSIISIRGNTKFDLSTIGLGVIHEEFNNPGRFANTDRQDTGSLRVKRTGVPYPPLPRQATHNSNNVKRSLPRGLIDIQYAVHD
jgi:hypothetical protein